MDHLEKGWDDLSATELWIARHSEEQRSLSKEPHWLHDTHHNNNHWASLAPDIHSATMIPSQTFPTQTWTDVMPPGLVDTNGYAAQQLQHTAHAPGYPATGSPPMAGVNTVWSTAGYTPGMPPAGGVHGGTCAYVGALPENYAHNGWNSSAEATMTNAASADQAAGGMWPHSSSATHVTASAAHQIFGEKRVHHAPEGGERYCSSSTVSRER